MGTLSAYAIELKLYKNIFSLNGTNMGGAGKNLKLENKGSP